MKKITSVFICIAMLVTMAITMGIGAFAAEDYESITDAATLAARMTSGETGVKLRLDADITTERIDPVGEVVLDLNGHVLRGTKRVFNVLGSLTIEDSNPTAVHKYNKVTHSVGRDWLILDDENGTIEIPGGVITGGVDSWVGGVCGSMGSTLIIKRANIIGNEASSDNQQCGGGLSLNCNTDPALTFEMYDGLIIGNISTAVAANDNAPDAFPNDYSGIGCTVIMKGGIIGSWSAEIASGIIAEGCTVEDITTYGGFSAIEIKDPSVVEEPVVEEPAVEEPVIEAPVVEEPVVEAPVVETVVAPVTTAPQTFDIAVIGVVSAVVALAGYSINKRK